MPFSKQTLVIALVAGLALAALPAFAFAQERETPAPPPLTPLATDCPDGWQAVSPSVNPVLRCLPTGITWQVSGQEPAPLPLAPDECPDGWRRVEPPLNPVLRCQPDQIVAES